MIRNFFIKHNAVQPVFFVALIAVLIAVFVLSLDIGATGARLSALWHHEETPDGVLARIVLMRIRAPRVVLAIMTGASLGIGGTIMQGLFRNPLADPGLIGVSPGAALAASCVIVLGTTFPAMTELGQWSIPVGGMMGGFATTTLLYMFATRAGATSISTVLLAGVAFGAFCGALTGILIFRANDQALRDLTFWTLGSLAGSTWQKVCLLLPFLAVAVIAGVRLAVPLNALLLSEEDARLMGYAVESTKRLSMLAVAACVGATVALVGAVGFVGVVVPHLVRLVTGPDHRLVLPGSALLGGILLVLSDTLARIIVTPAEVPVGIITAVIGAPVFAWLLTRAHKQAGSA